MLQNLSTESSRRMLILVGIGRLVSFEGMDFIGKTAARTRRRQFPSIDPEQ